MKTILNVKSAALIAATVFVTAAVPAQAGIFGKSEVRAWDVCDWERIPDTVMERITKRGDFDEILRRMFDACPDSALSLTDRPTASVSESGGFGNRQGSQDNSGSSNSPGNGGGGGGGGGGGTSNSPGGGGDEGSYGLPG